MRTECQIYGHEHNAAESCTACRAEKLETGTWPAGSHHRDAPTPTPRDAAMRAANDREDD